VIAIGAIALVAFFWVLGTLGQGDETPTGPANVGPTPTPTATPRKHRKHAPRKPVRVQLRLEATAPVYVCLVDAGGNQVIDGQTLTAGTRTKMYTSKRFTTNFGNDNIKMVVDGKSYPAATSADPIGYVLRPGKPPHQLSSTARPDCSA
jgi:hypothetical protein